MVYKGGVSGSGRDTSTVVNGAGAVVADDWTPGVNVECGRGHGFCW